MLKTPRKSGVQSFQRIQNKEKRIIAWSSWSIRFTLFPSKAFSIYRFIFPRRFYPLCWNLPFPLTGPNTFFLIWSSAAPFWSLQTLLQPSLFFTPLWFAIIDEGNTSLKSTPPPHWFFLEERYLALSDIAWNTQHWLCSLSLVVTEQDIKHIHRKKKETKDKL